MTGTVVGGLKENHTYAPFVGFSSTRGSQRDVVYLGWPIASSYMSPNGGEGGRLRGLSANEYSCAHGAQVNFGNLTPYLINLYGLSTLLSRQLD
jgi:hypothetical protein